MSVFSESSSRSIVLSLAIAAAFIALSLQGAPVAAQDSARAPDTAAVPAVKDTARSDAGKEGRKESKTVKISISDEGIRVGSEKGDKFILQVDEDELIGTFEGVMKGVQESMEHLQDSMAVYLFQDEDRGYAKVRGQDVVRFGERIHIGKRELVQGDVVSIGGDVLIEGKVRGNVVNVLGDTELDDTAIVNGDVVTVLGTLSEAPGARVRGETVSIAAGAPSFVFPLRSPAGGFFRLVGRVITFVIGTLLLMLIIYFLPDRMRAASDHVFGSFFKSFGTGILVIILGSVVVGIMVAILSITIIGIPVAILLGLSFAAVCILGYFTAALALGRVVCVKFGFGQDSLFLCGFVGLFLLSVLGLIGHLLWFNPLLVPARVILKTLGGFLNFLAVFTGTGALVVSRAGTARKETRPPEVPEEAGV